MRVLALLLFFLCVAVPVRAAGFEGPGVSPTVTFRKNRYLFGDGSGRVVVEIENDIFGHLTITPHDRVRLMGHVNWSRKRSNEVEVDALALID